MIITFINQHDCDDVNQCVEDIESSGGKVESTSFFADDLRVEINVVIIDEISFRTLFELTGSWTFSDF